MENINLDDIAVVIPSLDPDEQLVEYIQRLLVMGFTNIVVVNDGSRENHGGAFDQISKFKEVTLLKHVVNQGKGRALKTAFNYLMNTYTSEQLVGVVTADADGQHSPEDTRKVAERLKRTKAFVLGTRDFSKAGVPFKSRNGNRITTMIFALIYGEKIRDTQTGLRGIPYGFLLKCLEMDGERFEYEMRMLIEAVRSPLNIVEEDIQTIYINSNRATHFNVIRDSAKIYVIIFSEFLRFTFSGLLSFGVDIGIFAVLTKLVLVSMQPRTLIFLGTAIARIVSSLLNYSINRTAVFKNSNGITSTIIRYYLLSVMQFFCSWAFVTLIFERIGWDSTLIKTIVDTLLFLISYQIQKRWVFRVHKRKTDE